MYIAVTSEPSDEPSKVSIRSFSDRVGIYSVSFFCSLSICASACVPSTTFHAFQLLLTRAIMTLYIFHHLYYARNGCPMTWLLDIPSLEPLRQSANICRVTGGPLRAAHYPFAISADYTASGRHTYADTLPHRLLIHPSSCVRRDSLLWAISDILTCSDMTQVSMLEPTFSFLLILLRRPCTVTHEFFPLNSK